MLSYSVKGSGPAWVFLHGFLESSSMWESLPLDDLPIQQIKIDLPGHGKSSQLLNLLITYPLQRLIQQIGRHTEMKNSALSLSIPTMVI